MSTSQKFSASQKGLPVRQTGLAPILIVLLITIILLTPIPTRVGEMFCLVDSCPKEGTIVWNPPLAYQFLVILDAKLQNKNQEPSIKIPPPSNPSAAIRKPNGTGETTSWKTYTNTKYGYSIKYSPEKFINCSHNDDEFRLYEGGEGTRECALGEEHPVILLVHKDKGIGDVDNSSNPECYSIEGEQIQFAGMDSTKYTRLIKNNQGECQFISSVEKNQIDIVSHYKGNLFIILLNEYLDKEIKYQILSTFRFLP